MKLRNMLMIGTLGLACVAQTPEFKVSSSAPTYKSLAITGTKDAPIITVKLPKSTSGVDEWDCILDKETSWTFRIDGKEYTLTGAELARKITSN